jgi:hypothetical protein
MEREEEREKRRGGGRKDEQEEGGCCLLRLEVARILSLSVRICAVPGIGLGGQQGLVSLFLGPYVPEVASLVQTQTRQIRTGWGLDENRSKW